MGLEYLTLYSDLLLATRRTSDAEVGTCAS
jgi:hypothetical protein